MTMMQMFDEALKMFDYETPIIIEMAQAVEDGNDERVAELYDDVRTAYFDLLATGCY